LPGIYTIAVLDVRMSAQFDAILQTIYVNAPETVIQCTINVIDNRIIYRTR